MHLRLLAALSLLPFAAPARATHLQADDPPAPDKQPIVHAAPNSAAPSSDHPTSDIPHRFLLVGLDWPSEKINPRINQRVKHMMESGFLEEVRALRDSGAFAPTANPQAREALGYKQLLDHLEGRRSLEDAVERIKIDTRHFAKTQRTWLKRLRLTPGSMWIDANTLPHAEWVDRVHSILAPSS